MWLPFEGKGFWGLQAGREDKKISSSVHMVARCAQSSIVTLVEGARKGGSEEGGSAVTGER